MTKENEEEKQKKALEDEISNMIGEDKPPEKPTGRIKKKLHPSVLRPAPIRDIAHLNDSFYKFLVKQLLLVVATKLCKEDPKRFVTDIIEHFSEDYKNIIRRKHEQREADNASHYTGDGAELHNELGNIEKKNELEGIENYEKMMKQQLLDLIGDNDFNEFDELDDEF